MHAFIFLLLLTFCKSSHREGAWITRAILPPQLIRAQNASKLPWCGNCTIHQRALEKLYQSSKAPDIDIVTASPGQLNPLNGLEILLLGDSLMRQLFYSFFWVFPGTKAVASTPSSLSNHCRDVNFSLVVPHLNCSIHYCPNAFLGPHMHDLMPTLFGKNHFDFVIVNSGLWYNKDIKNISKEYIENVRKRPNIAKGWTPLSSIQYIDDLKLFNQQISAHKGSNHPISDILWLQSSPQHLKTGTFHFSDLKNHAEVCTQFSEHDMKNAYWRNEISSSILDIPIVEIFYPLADLYFSHPTSSNGVPDCTHFCNPGAGPLFIAQRVLNVVMKRTTSSLNYLKKNISFRGLRYSEFSLYT